MNNLRKKTIVLLFNLFASLIMVAQPTNTSRIEMADGLYQSGKIFVVVVVLLIIFTGIIIYLILLDRKISKLEKEIKNK
ncbi:MAG: CcmD family protein [Bacteroidia bacterium]